MRLLLLLLLAGCSPSSPPELEEIRGEAMTMDYRIVTEEGSDLEPIIRKTFEEIDQIYNNWNPDSEVSRLGRLPAFTPAQLSPQLLAFLQQVGHWVERTGGLFDPTVAPLQRLWRERLESGATPTKEELAALEQVVGWSHIHIEEGLFWKDHDGVLLDFGGVAKGYCVDLLHERIAAAGRRHIFVEWSGEIRVSGGHPEGRPWRIAIRDPNARAPAAVTEMWEGAVATSGNYHQWWQTRDGLYTHICDPRTLQALQVGADTVSSATVQTSSCFAADLMATVLMIEELPINADSCQIWRF